MVYLPSGGLGGLLKVNRDQYLIIYIDNQGFMKNILKILVFFEKNKTEKKL